MPGALAGQVAGTGNEGTTLGALLPPPAALAVIVAYMVVPLGVALVLLPGETPDADLAVVNRCCNAGQHRGHGLAVQRAHRPDRLERVPEVAESAWAAGL